MSVHIFASLRLMRSQCRSSRDFSTHFPQFAKPRKSKPVKASLPSRPSVPKATATPKQSITGSTDVQQLRAAQLYNDGVREIYREGGRGKIIASWVVGAGCLFSAGLTASLRLWDADNLVGMRKWHKAFIVGANRVVPIFLTIVGGYTILRYAGAIRSIRLVAVSQSRVGLKVHLRRRVPWSNTRYLIEPSELRMPRNWRRGLTPGVESRGGQKLADTLGSPYQWLKAWINMDQIVNGVWVGKDSAGYLDSDGKFGVSLDDFASITSEQR